MLMLGTILKSHWLYFNRLTLISVYVKTRKKLKFLKVHPLCDFHINFPLPILSLVLGSTLTSTSSVPKQCLDVSMCLEDTRAPRQSGIYSLILSLSLTWSDGFISLLYISTTASFAFPSPHLHSRSHS